MDNNKKLVGDISRGYMFMDKEEAIKHEMFCDTIGKYLGLNGNKTNYNKPMAPLSSKVFAIRTVIFNPPATIVYWEDGTKTIVKAHNEDFDPEKGLAMAISKKALGNKGNYFNVIKKWVEPKLSQSDNSLSSDLAKAFRNILGR